MLQRLYANWVYGGVIAGLMLLALTPLLAARWTWAETLVFLALPVYMLHQYEEHDNDRFRHYVNTVMLPGRGGLSLRATWIINIIGVWGLLTLVLWLVHRVDTGWGTIAAYLTLINAVAHIGPAIRGRAYNPGLATAALLFLPLGAATLHALWPLAQARHHAGGIALVVGLHAWIMLHAGRKA